MLNSLTNPCFEQFVNVFADIINNVQIHANFWIAHPNYPTQKLPTEAVERFQQLPQTVQNKYLSLQLRNFLYDIYYSGGQKTNAVKDRPLENNTMRGLNVDFYQKLHASNCGTGFYDAGWLVLREEKDLALAVKKNGLTLHIDRTFHLPSSHSSATVGDLIAIRMPKNRVEEGFYVAVGNAGLIDNCEFETVEIYFNIGSEGAIVLMQAITQQFNEINLPFTFKVLSDPEDYGCYDAGILCFDRKDYEIVRRVLQDIYTQNYSHFQPSIPLFAKFLASGLSLAESPEENFGLNRCQIVADGLLEAWQKDDRSPEARMNSIRQEFSQLGIDWHRPYLNPDSQDIYTPLNL